MRQKEGENMKDAFEKLFRAVHQFKKLNVSDLIPGLSSSEFSVMGAILQMGENGKIVEHGTHQELLAAQGRYYQLYTLQYHREQSEKQRGRK